MIIDNVVLKNYRNYDKVKVNFCNKTNIIIGDNAQGKTNILEAIYFLSITKSYRTTDDNNLIKSGKLACKVSAKLKKNGVPKKIEINVSNKQKMLYLNNNQLKKVSDFIGILNIIMVAPEDIEIIKSSPSIRRNLLNIELSKLSKEYITIHNEYNKLLKMRNDYLKIMLTSNIADNRYLDIITHKLIERAIYIYTERKKIIDEVNPILLDIYKDITGIDNLSIYYIPNIEIERYDIESLKKRLADYYHKYQKKEISIGMTIYGPHRDDFKILIGDKDIKYFGSQGQQKLAIIALKLALVKVFFNRTGDIPIILLDDIFSELDRKRKNKLIDYINNSGQVIITTNDIRDINRKKLENIKIFQIRNKNIIEKGD